MRVESMVAQQAVLAATARQSARGSRAERPADGLDSTPAQAAGSRLPTEVADRLADFFASDPGFAAAVSAQLPAARQASARDLAAYGRHDHPRLTTPQLIDVSG